MGKSVICISRSIGAGGEDVGRLVAERLGYRYVDEEIIHLASEHAHVDPRLVADVEQRTSLMERLIDALFARPTAETYSLRPRTDAPKPPTSSASPEELRTMIREAIRETARRGGAVIVAHAASFAVGSRPDVLRVFVTATPKTRSRRLCLDGPLLSDEQAELAVTESDEERHHYLRTFYDVAHELPTHYDIVVNTDTLSARDAAAIVLAAARP
jgi:cytidylate kinase